MARTHTFSSWVEVDIAAIGHNVRELSRYAGPNAHVMAVLKADAYGHGAELVAPVALENGATHLALATLAEARTLREEGITAPILLLGYIPPEQVEEAIALNLSVTLFDSQVAHALSAAALKLQRTARAHLKIDTGMSRLGVLPYHALSFAQLASSLPGIEIEGIYTHLATADGDWEIHAPPICTPEPYYDKSLASHAITLTEVATLSQAQVLAHTQLARFEVLLDRFAAAQILPRYIHASNSATLLRLHRHYPRHNLVRPGLALYGLLPFCPSLDEELPDLRPALSWHTRIARVVDLPPDTSISYGARYTTHDWQRIATLPVGYADGLRRSPAWQEVIINGQRAPIVGRICMDYVMCDVSHISTAKVGDRATLLGKQDEAEITADEVATWLDTSAYEVLTSIGSRVGRVAV
jgi:Alanine racemase